MTSIVTISDTHTYLDRIPVLDGDILIHAGDCSFRGNVGEVSQFLKSMSELPHKYKIFIAGNHDWGFEDDPQKFEKMAKDAGIIYLNDSGVTIEGIKIWGSPVSPRFCDWAFNRETDPNQDFYMAPYTFIGHHWDKIPEDTDILVTHGPPKGYLDVTSRNQHVGCPILVEKLKTSNIKMHIFGHIHEGRGVDHMIKPNGQILTLVNTSSVDSRYIVVNHCFCFDWEKVKLGRDNGKNMCYYSGKNMHLMGLVGEE